MAQQMPAAGFPAPAQQVMQPAPPGTIDPNLMLMYQMQNQQMQQTQLAMNAQVAMVAANTAPVVNNFNNNNVDTSRGTDIVYVGHEDHHLCGCPPVVHW
eukprot:CAMPEP_0177583354 /NCGR_PEP_ID=MMETSP0419_2-20121207/3271_1 /TAXON_ID=582737 /ORGANISM="Tetraselmis sp., Strain GSL018" /LENGTH=98 /DNA_ID=CAMNT_0019072727 /DNA_START=573 /DNA_END=866 /DNA_ORIENTATION=-